VDAGRGDGPTAEVLATGGATVDAVALPAALHQPWTTVVLLRAAAGDQLASNLRAEALTVDPTRWGSLAVPADRYWPERAERPWA
jgi:aryl-alcohol dehydrogenase-like predicted oxidoreductase